MSAVAAPIRPTQALRQRRESNRPGIARISTRGNTADATDGSPPPPVPFVRTQDYILKKYNGRPPSLILHLHPTHFRFDQQDGNFSYNSPMNFVLKHLRDGTIPHEMLEELFKSDVPFYDGCLIVEVHDHKSGANKNPGATTNAVGVSANNNPFSVHNYNEHITPSAFVPFPRRERTPQPPKQDVAIKGEKDADKENMPAPGQPASATQRKGRVPDKVFTRVLFPTDLSFNEEKSILARTPLATGSKRTLSRDGATPAQPPTPAVPSTPTSAKGQNKEPKMALDEHNVHEFEADYLLATETNLYLEPAKGFEHMLDIMKMMEHPMHMGSPPKAKTRKRTVAQMEADVEQALKEERFMLSLDERHQQTSGAAGGTSNEGASSTATHEPFKRFKTLETIKQHHQEQEREKKEQEAQERLRKEQAKEQDTARKREQALREQQQMQSQQMQTQQMQSDQLEAQKAALLQRQKQAQAEHARQAMEAQLAQVRANQQSQQQAQMANHQSPIAANGMANGLANGMMQNAAQHQMAQQQQTQAPAMSPVMRQQTPMSASSPMLNGINGSMGLTSVPMTVTASGQGVASPARPPSAMQHHAGPMAMARQASQQQMASSQGTPQMQGTPHMGAAALASRAATMTPQPGRPNTQGSPVNGMQSTPMMPSGSMAGLTPEQQQTQMNMIRMRQIQQAQAQNQARLQASGMSAQQIALIQAQQAATQQHQMGLTTPVQQNAQMAHNQQQLAQIQMQAQQQAQQMRQMQAQAAANQNGGLAQQMAQVNQNITRVQLQVQQYMSQLQPQSQQILQNWKTTMERKLLVQIMTKKASFITQQGNVPGTAQRWQLLEMNERTTFWQGVLNHFQKCHQQASLNGGNLPPQVVNALSHQIQQTQQLVQQWQARQAQAQGTPQGQQPGAQAMQQQQSQMSQQSQQPGAQQMQQQSSQMSMANGQTPGAAQMNPAYVQQLRAQQQALQMQQLRQQQAQQAQAQQQQQQQLMNAGINAGMNMQQQMQMQQMLQQQQLAQQQQAQINAMNSMNGMGGMNMNGM